MAQISETVLVLGASGGFGGAVARELVRRNRPVRAFARHPQRAARALGGAPGLEIVRGDVQDLDSLVNAARGCGAIVHGVNYPYREWRPRMVTATENVIAAARFAGATVLFPGNVYGLGPQTEAPLPETAPNLPNTAKGRLRVELEEMLERSVYLDVPRVVVLRAGDYFGPTVRNGLVDRIFGNAAAGRPIRFIGDFDKPHQWTFAPDLARLGVELLDRARRLEPFEVVHFRGFVAEPQRAFLTLVAREAGYPGLRPRRIPWWLLRLAGVFDPTVRELMELRYLFDEAVILDDPRRRALFPDFPSTAIEQAVRETLASYRRAPALTP